MFAKRLFLIFACTLLLLSTAPVVQNASADPISENNVEELTENYQELSVVNWVKKAFQYAFKAAPWDWLVFNRDPIIEEHERTTTVSSGTIKFNTEDRGPTYVRKDLIFDEYAGQDAWIWGSRAPLFTGKIAVEIINQKTNKTEAEKVLEPLAQLQFDPNDMGSWYIKWTNTESNSWNLFFTYRHRYKQLPGQSIAPIEFVNVNDKKYIKPSNSHKQELHSFNVKPYYTLDELFDELWDEQLGDFVYEFKSLGVGDTVHFKDSLVAAHYNSEKDVTNLEFKSSKFENVFWPFKGDLTQLFKPGDVIDLKFTVEQIDGQFEILDYIRMDYNNEVADIKDFLIE
ncbi:hypothetical protein M5X06_09310 [Paenibacillus alvei]|uniref:Uncharacterized protein n=1 Tax=Paenibacillus alvei TaxID=44250 RepID=A0ABT4H4M6_PAEAL|nr:MULTISPECIES: hypothetical protein [Paenibacillus]MCY7483715.1 hypothetical protein [Paenibacillus alvei]MCY9763931.1 hypothetical protein [Paenibacillus alvei]MCY9767026.1 hypothetical protein [Paenibacillus alvei]